MRARQSATSLLGAQARAGVRPEEDKGGEDVDKEKVGGGMGGAKHKKTQFGQRERHSINMSLADSAEAQGKKTLKEALSSEEPPSSHLHTHTHHFLNNTKDVCRGYKPLLLTDP